MSCGHETHQNLLHPGRSCIQGSTKTSGPLATGSQSDIYRRFRIFVGKHTGKQFQQIYLTCFGKIPSIYIYTHRNTLFNAQKQKQDWQSSGIREPTASYLAPSTEINRIYIVRVAIGASRRAWCFRTVLLLLLFQHCNRKDLQKKHEALLP